MREARIRLEAQRDWAGGVRSTDSAKPLHHNTPIGVGGTSITTSQDRTTMATWGGSSLTAPSTAYSAEEEAAEADQSEYRSAPQGELLIHCSSSLISHVNLSLIYLGCHSSIFSGFAACVVLWIFPLVPVEVPITVIKPIGDDSRCLGPEKHRRQLSS